MSARSDHQNQLLKKEHGDNDREERKEDEFNGLATHGQLAQKALYTGTQQQASIKS